MLIENIETLEQFTFLIVGPDESDPEEGRISYLSPIGNALMGTEIEGDVEVSTPEGMKYFAVLEIQRPSS